MTHASYLSAAILLAVGAAGTAAAQAPRKFATCHDGVPWSTRFASLQPGDFARIPAGETVILDTATVPLGGLMIEGRLIFDHDAPVGTVQLNTAYAIVTGTLRVGCEVPGGLVRFDKHTEINLIAPERYGGPQRFPFNAGVNWPPEMEMAFHHHEHIKEAALDRGLIVAGPGHLLLYGADKGVSWTTLARTADPGDTLLFLDESALGLWDANDRLALASTDFEYADPVRPGAGGRTGGYLQDEDLQLQGFSGTNGIVVAPPLAYQHYAATETYSFPGGGQDSITMKAEIANLTRSIVIQGEHSAFSSQEGTGGVSEHLGHVALMAMMGDDRRPECKVEWVEFRNLGVEAKLARYPFHFHDLGEPPPGQDAPYLKYSSIHHCVNRFVSVHDTRMAIVEGNVGYDTRSTGFFLEDTIERDDQGEPLFEQIYKTQRNVLRNNLGFKVAPQYKRVNLPPEYSHDLDSINVSVFWANHPNQKIEGNHAAGAAGHGFYLVPGKDAPWTHKAHGGSYFRNNVAHSNGQHGFLQQSRIPWQYDESSGDQPAAEGLIAWKNRRYGIWWRTFGVALLDRCKTADNKSGIYPASEGRTNAYGGPAVAASSSLIIRDSLIVGFSDGNLGLALNPAEQRAGRSLPQTYFYFTRPDRNSIPHESPWDTINALESYDGLNLFESLRIVNFRDPANGARLPDPEGRPRSVALPVAAITQIEYNSCFAEDPRNALLVGPAGNWQFSHVTARLNYRPTWAGNGYSMLRNTIVRDVHDVLGYGRDVYLTYADPFFAANRAPQSQFAEPPGTNAYLFRAADVDFAQIRLAIPRWTGGPGSVIPPRLRVDVRAAPIGGSGSGPLRSQVLAKMVEEGIEMDEWVFNASLGLWPNNPLTEQTGIYFVSYLGRNGQPPRIPANYEVHLQFCERAGVPTILALPLAAAPQSVAMLDPLLAFARENSLSALQTTAQPHAYYWDASTQLVFVKTTTALFWGGTAAVEGTRNHFLIQ